MTDSVVEQQGEQCVRCKEWGEDRRTLHMSCLYDMAELGIPLEEYRLKGEAFAKNGVEELWFGDEAELRAMGMKPHTISTFSPQPTTTVDRAFYSQRVCKDCRAEWMTAIKEWFERGQPQQQVESCGSGIFIRELGTIREITREEWEARRKGAGR